MASLTDPETDDPILFEVPDPTGSPRDAASDREVATELSCAIGGLSEKQRTVFVLHHLQGIPLAEIGQMMGCRVGTVKVHIFRAMAQLRTALSPFMEGGG